MLVLTREPGQRIFIRPKNGPEITLLVTQVRGDRVWLAFEAPREVVIVRDDAIDQGGHVELPPMSSAEQVERRIQEAGKVKAQ